MADVLFLLQPDFRDEAIGSGTFYCPDCAAVKGILSYYPRLLDVLDVREVQFPRPRAEVAALLGPNHPGCPVLVLDFDSPIPGGMQVKLAPTGHNYIEGRADIGAYLAGVHEIAAPHP